MKRLLPVVFSLMAILPVAGQSENASRERLPAPTERELLPAATVDGQRPPSPRLAKLRALQFDRRPSAILRAWATPPGAEVEEEPTTPAGPQPVPEGVVVGPDGTPQPQPPGAAEGKKAKDPIDRELAEFKRMVTLGQWGAVKAYLAGLTEEEAAVGYKQMLQSLQGQPVSAPMPMMDMGGMMGMPGMPMIHLGQLQEQNQFSVEDVVGLAQAAPKGARGLEKDHLASLGNILRKALTNASVVEHAVAVFQKETARPEASAALTRRQAAKLLVGANEPAAAGPFLPSVEEARREKDHEGLNLLARHFLGLHAREKKAPHLEQAWLATQAALALPDAKLADKEEAVRRAVELAPKVKEELGQVWLEESFTRHPERGMDILAAIGSAVSQGLQRQPMNKEERLKALQLQKTAVEALLKASPARAEEWKPTLTLLASAWWREADYTRQRDRSTGLGPRMRRDMYGNYYFWQDEEQMEQMMMRQQNLPLPIVTGEMLLCAPSPKWVSHIEEGLKPKLTILFAQLFLKVGEEEKAFPYIEGLAASHPVKAKELVDEFLRVWAKNHDPNDQRRHTNPYFYFYGFERRAESIPLTRSKQERNLQELTDWVKRLKKLPIGDPDEELLAQAFIKSHSSAEVYRLEVIEKVFGPLGGIKPRTLASLAQQMRENLAGVWREPANQKDKKTNRKQKDIQAEVLRGYALAGKVVEDALAKFPDDWALTLARAALLHDEVNFKQEVAKSSEFSANREEAFKGFAQAAKLYAAKVKQLSEDEETTKVYDQWFYASLGACDPQHIKEDKLPDLRQPARIRAALLALPAEVIERHLTKFASNLVTRMSGIAPAVKFRYLKSGFEIVGDNKHAWEAKKVFDYYKDLVTEIKLETVVDGSDVVGHGKPFGVFVNLRHTREIERESGGFGRYLQNQNSMFWAYNYGRPTADYRDKFQSAVTEALKEHFDVVSITFQSENVHSRATSEYGWRVTPYAYLLLKAKGPQVDKLPPLRLDLDFLDTSGYAVLPVESPALVIDARPEKAEPRPLRKLQLTQILDERQASQGKLVLEVKATGLGLVGELDTVLDLQPEDFEVAKVDDQGVSVAKFDQEGDETAVVSERTWLVSLVARAGRATPTAFRFGASRVPGAELTYQRYVDADLATAGPEVALERQYGGGRPWWLYVAVGGGVVIVLVLGTAAVLLVRRRSRREAEVLLPGHLTPFTVLTLLQRLEKEARLNESQRAELGQAIRTLERRYFADEVNGDGEVNLRQLAESWLRRAQAP